MCGIVLIISKNENNIIKYLLQGLSLIQNRGYDSLGITFKDDNKFNNIINYDNNNIFNSTENFKIIKYASENTSDSFELLKKSIEGSNIKSSIGLGHTRWATHGSKTTINSHPHISHRKHFILVHNGIINNYKKLKTFLESKNIQFYSETDTEVIVNLLEYYYLYDDICKLNVQLSIEKLNNNLEGTWALGIIDTNDNTSLYITRHGSPLVLGYSENLFICASEINGFAGLVLNYIVIDNNDIIKINKTNYTTINSDKNYQIEKIDKNYIIDTCYPYNHWTYKEIMEQPQYIESALNNGGRIVNNKIKLGGVTELIRLVNNDLKNIKHIMLFGCGTSYHACMLAKYYFSNKKIIHIIDACEFSEIDIPYLDNNDKILCIYCSQSGETIDIVKCINICNKYNCINYGIINVVDSLISRLVHCGTYINSGREIAVASTKSFTNTLIILFLLGSYFNNNFENIQKISCLRLLSNTINKLLYDTNISEDLNNISSYIVDNDIKNIFILGKNKLFPIAKEISLKIKEICYIHAEGYSSSSLKHGPFALLDKSNLTILLIDYNDKENLKNLESTYNEISSRDTNILVVSNNKDIKNILNKSATTCPKLLILYSLQYFNEIIFTISLQLLSYNISIKKNINPDKPRNLAKVVTVE